MKNRSVVVSVKEKFQPFKTNVVIPAYDKNKNGMMLNLVMEVSPNDFLTVEADGTVAIGLKKNLGRAITILSNIDSFWEILRKIKYNLISMENQYRVMDARSAGLPLCIALLNIARTLNGVEQVQHITGTGILRIDGTFEKAHLEEEKKQVTSQLMENMFINSHACKHVFNLATLMNGP